MEATELARVRHDSSLNFCRIRIRQCSLLKCRVRDMETKLIYRNEAHQASFDAVHLHFSLHDQTALWWRYVELHTNGFSKPQYGPFQAHVYLYR